MGDSNIKIKDADGVVHPVDTRTVTGGDERQVFLIGDGENAGLLSPATEGTLAGILAAVDGLEGYTDQLETLLTALGTNTDGIEALLTTLNAAQTHGTYAYASGTAATTVDVPAGARVKRVSVIAGAGTATVTIAAGATITIPAGGSFDEQIPGDATAGGDVVIAGTVSSYYVGWVA